MGNRLETHVVVQTSDVHTEPTALEVGVEKGNDGHSSEYSSGGCKGILRNLVKEMLILSRMVNTGCLKKMDLI